MKKFPLLCCLLILAACSKNEVIPPPDNISSHTPSVAVSHLDNDDLTLVDGLIQLKISKEEAVNRGVPASEYDLVEGTIARHNETKGPLTKSVSRQMLAWGILEYPSTQYHSNSVSGLRVDAVGTGSIILYYTMGSDPDGYSILDYSIYGAYSAPNSVFGLGRVDGSIPFPDFWWGFMSLSYTYWGIGTGVCVYSVEEY